MVDFINEFISTLSTQYYIHQCMTIIALECYGLLFIRLTKGCKWKVDNFLIAYPLSLAMYSLTGYFLLSVGIVFNRVSITIFMLAILVFVAIVFRHSNGINNREIKLIDTSKKNIIVAIIAIIVVALFSTSGVLKISATNDSMYFFQEYPRALIHYGRLNHHLDNFLTDASQGIAVIGTLPFLFGFDEIYGIMAFLNVDYICIFAYAVYVEAKKKITKKSSIAIMTVSILILVSSMPFVIMSRWFMANMFFMEYMFMVVYFSYNYICELRNIEDREYIIGINRNDTKMSNLLIISILLTGLSIMRMEGALTAGFLVLCIMMLEYKNRDVALYFVLPMLLLQTLYLFRIFVLITLFTGYQFMTKQKAIILIAFLVFVGFYALVIRNRFFVRIQKYYSWLLVGGLTALNVLVFFYDTGDYITNLKAFAANVLRNSGWGLFASFVIGVFILIPKKSIKINYFDVTVVCYILLTIVTGWARGDTLYESFGDSGNRILIQVVPIMLFALIIKVIEGIEFWEKEKLS